MSNREEIEQIKEVLLRLKEEGRIAIALLYGSYANGSAHIRSDIDLGLYLTVNNRGEEIEVIDSILLSVDREVAILRLDDEDESPFIVQEALKGIHLVEPDMKILYALSHRVLHETESIRFRRGLLNCTE